MKSDAVNYGLNAENRPYRDDRYVRCARCGFICHLDRDRKSIEGSRAGWGITYTAYEISDGYDSNIKYDGTASLGYDDVSVEYDQGAVSGVSLYYDGVVGESNYDGVARTIYDPVRTGGCPQCGTYLYNKNGG